MAQRGEFRIGKHEFYMSLAIASRERGLGCEGHGIVVLIDGIRRILKIGVDVRPVSTAFEGELHGVFAVDERDVFHRRRRLGLGVESGCVAVFGEGFGAIEDGAGGFGHVGRGEAERVIPGVHERGAALGVLRAGAVIVREVKPVPQLVGEAAVPFGQETTFGGVVSQMLDVEIGVVQSKTVAAVTEERNAPGRFVVVALIVERGHNDERVAGFFLLRVFVEIGVDVSETRFRTLDRVGVVCMRERSANEEDVDMAVFLHVEAERTGAEAVALHLLAVKLLEIEQQFADAALVIRDRFVVVPQKIHDIHLMGARCETNARG